MNQRAEYKLYISMQQWTVATALIVQTFPSYIPCIKRKVVLRLHLDVAVSHELELVVHHSHYGGVFGLSKRKVVHSIHDSRWQFM